MRALCRAAAERHVVHVGELGDRGFARAGRDEMAAEVGQLGQCGLVAILDVVEDRLHPRRDLVILAQFFGERIDPGAGFFHREMEMRPGRKAGRTDISNDLPDMNVAARLDVGANLRQMTVDADHLMLMLDADAVAELALPSRAYDRAIGDGLDRLAVFGDQIDADMRPVLVQNRMIAMEGEARGNVLEIEWKLQGLRTERVALFVIQMSAAVFVRERYRRQGTAPKADLRCLHVAGERVRAVAADLFIVNQLDRGTGREAIE